MSEIIIEMPPDFSHQVPFFFGEILRRFFLWGSTFPRAKKYLNNANELGFFLGRLTDLN